MIRLQASRNITIQSGFFVIKKKKIRECFSLVAVHLSNKKKKRLSFTPETSTFTFNIQTTLTVVKDEL